MTILVIAEHDNKVLAPATLNTVAAAAKIGGDIHVLVAGLGAGAVAEAAAKIAGVPTCWWRETPLLYQLQKTLLLCCRLALFTATSAGRQ